MACFANSSVAAFFEHAKGFLVIRRGFLGQDDLVDLFCVGLKLLQSSCVKAGRWVTQFTSLPELKYCKIVFNDTTVLHPR